jgi:hypothetical protein
MTHSPVLKVPKMKMRSKITLNKYGLTEESFTVLYESQNGCCAICEISEPALEAKYSAPTDWPSDRVLHIDHEHGSVPTRVRGLLCFVCNFDLEAHIRGARIIHPGNRGVSEPRNDPRFKKYLAAGGKRTRVRA